MFVQVIEGRVADRGSLRSQQTAWERDLRPGAPGFLGSTWLVTADDRFIAFARFDSEADARTNSDRPEQGEWWVKTATSLAGEAQFAESSDVELFFGGGSDDAGFVQVMKSHGVDRRRLAKIDAAFASRAAEVRPDVVGGLRVWTSDGTCYDATYFTSEADARTGESQALPDDFAAVMAEFGDLMRDVEYLDSEELLLG